MARRWPTSARRRRRARNQRAQGQVATALDVVRPVVNGCLYSFHGDYCGEEVVIDCSLCHVPLCSGHVVDKLDEVLCPTCYEGYLQQAGSWGYVSEEKV